METTKTGRKRSSTKRTKKTSTPEKWSQDVTQHSNALDLESGVFKNKDPKKIAQSLKRSAAHSKRKKSSPYQSAMSMLTSTSIVQERACQKNKKNHWRKPRVS